MAGKQLRERHIAPHLTAVQLAEQLTGLVVTVPAGSRIGWGPGGAIDSTEDLSVVVRIDGAGLAALARQALKNKSGSARDGAISFRVVRR